MSRSKKSNQIVKSLVNLSHDLGMEVVAEGIESENEAELMRNYKAAFGQGFYFSRPVNETEFVKLLRQPQIELAG
jgi:EAL domain-containing protein (putative c-di-GMP-specific phosphodiesterase class I)